jgi:hypothetical protein
MLAVLHIAVPFTMIVPLHVQFNLYAASIDGYEVTFDVPKSSGTPATLESPDYVLLNEMPAYMADVLEVRCRSDSFDRRVETEIDPPKTTIAAVVGSFLERLKFVVRAPQVRLVEFPLCRWHLRYLSDDGSELVEEEGFVRGRGAAQFSFGFVALHPNVWDSTHSLPHEYKVEPWHSLLVDARGALPHVGTAVVLAATALEVFIGAVLTRLASESTVPKELWGWITDRGDWQKEPSVEEQFSVLLHVLCGHSLKEDEGLWEAFKNLRTARNSFVHEGRAMLGKQPLQADRAAALIDKADQLLVRVREWLPEHMRWPVYAHAVQVTVGKKIASTSSAASKNDPVSEAT